MVRLTKQAAIGGLLLFGTGCSLIAKLIYFVSAPTPDGHEAFFRKPWLQVLIMFLGMSFCIILDKPARRPAGKPAAGETTPLAGADAETEIDPKSPSVWIINLPTLFDLFATACGTVGLLYTSVSIYQMLRGAQLVFCALFSVVFLKRSLSKYNLAGIALAVTGITAVGAANVLSSSTPEDKAAQMFGVIVIVLGQLLQASQIVLEDFLLSNLKMTSMKVVAYEGLFGMLHCLLWVLPILQILPGNNNGSVEDSLESWHMVTHSWKVIAVVATDMSLMLCYNVCGMEVTQHLTGVHRVILETLRTLCVWIIDLFLYYVFAVRSIGEPWTLWSFVQLGGFACLISGTLCYNYEDLFKKTTPPSTLPGDASTAPADSAAGLLPIPATSEPVGAGYDASSPVPPHAMPFGSPAHAGFLGVGTPASFRQSHMMQ